MMIAAPSTRSRRVRCADARELRALERRRVDDVISSRHTPWMVGADERPTPWRQGGSWSPLAFGPALACWYSSDAPFVTLDGSNNVQTLTDRSGNGTNATQGTAADRPAYVSSGGGAGRAYLKWPTTSGNNMCLVAALALAQPFETFAALRYVQTNPGPQSAYLYDGGINQNLCGTIGVGSTLQLYDGAGGACAVTPSTGADHVLDSFVSGASSFQSLDGGAHQNGNPGTSSGGGTNFTLGNYGSGSHGAGWQSWLYEIFVITRAATASERTFAVSYLGAKYGVAV